MTKPKILFIGVGGAGTICAEKMNEMNIPGMECISIRRDDIYYREDLKVACYELEELRVMANPNIIPESAIKLPPEDIKREAEEAQEAIREVIQRHLSHDA